MELFICLFLMICWTVSQDPLLVIAAGIFAIAGEIALKR